MSGRDLLPPSWRKSIKIWRVMVAERLGSQRYSWPALNEIDKQMVRRIGTDPGTFLEVGANDGYSQSNTFFLERHLGWEGILIEPIPHLARRAIKLRKRSQCFGVACVAKSEVSTVQMADLDLTSVALGHQCIEDQNRRLGARHFGRREVSAMTLSDVIETSRFCSIDFMSVDVEGTELEVLAGLDFERHTPTWLLVETNQPHAVEELCRGWMDMVDKLSHHDYILRRSVQ